MQFCRKCHETSCNLDLQVLRRCARFAKHRAPTHRILKPLALSNLQGRRRMPLAVAQIPFRRLLWAPFPSDVTKAIRCVVDDDDDEPPPLVPPLAPPASPSTTTTTIIIPGIAGVPTHDGWVSMEEFESRVLALPPTTSKVNRSPAVLLQLNQIAQKFDSRQASQSATHKRQEIAQVLEGYNSIDCPGMPPKKTVHNWL